MAPRRARPLALFALLGALAPACGGVDGPAARTLALDDDDGTQGPGLPGEDGGLPGAFDDAGATSCTGALRVAALTACLDDGRAPRACLAEHPAADACDVDGDALDDGLEDALLRAYAPVFAFNRGNGTKTRGNDEPCWPGNPRDYAATSTLIWRREADGATARTIAIHPDLDALPGFVHEGRRADDPTLGAGPNFWLCLDKSGATYSEAAKVGSATISRALPHGVEVVGVVHPTAAGSRFAFVGSMIYFHYNEFSFDDHEGDWEGGAAFVDLDDGAVVALFADRHPSADDEKLTHLVGPSRAPVVDPTGDPAKYNVCGAGDVPRGVRFYDHDEKRHHPVLYVSTGGHASYAYPGATKITGAGCVEATIVRDTHNGENEKLAPHLGGYTRAFGDGAGDAEKVRAGVRFTNAGEPSALRAPWTAFMGHWGCEYGRVAKSYPGPWDNEQLCRRWLTHVWGFEPPFVSPGSGACR